MKNVVKFAAVAVVAVGLFTTACKPKTPEAPAGDSVNTAAPATTPETTAPAMDSTAKDTTNTGGATTK